MTYVIGDVHGMLDELRLLVDAIHTDAEQHRAGDTPRSELSYPGTTTQILIVGDLVDRGPDSAGVLDYLIENKEKYNIRSVQGNHDAWLCKGVRDAQKRIQNKENLFTWLTQGGYESIASYDPSIVNTQGADLSIDSIFASLQSIPEEHVHFLENLPLVIDTETCIVTHALCNRRYYDLLQEYNGKEVPEYIKLFVQWNRDEPSAAISTSKIHVSGHTAVRTVRYFRRTNAVNIDTGAASGGRLSALCIESRQVLSIDARTHQFVQTHLIDR